MADDTVEQQVEWWKSPDIFGRLATDINHVIKLKREIVPIVFVPGIMGTRLEQSATGTVAWDPDSAGFLAKWAVLNEAGRKRLMVNTDPDQSFSTEYLRPITRLANSTAKALNANAGDSIPNAVEAKERGWGELIWDKSYGTFILALSRIQPRMREGIFGLNIPLELDRIFATPVYAVGYNWSDSCNVAGPRLATRIKEIKARESANGPCEKVIVMTHSMGGLVSRSASELVAGGRDDIQGIIHGVQPAIGASAAYWRMKGGFERHGFVDPPAWLIGPTGAYVTALLGNMPGGLELLPHPDYRVLPMFPSRDSGWLRFVNKTGAIVKTLPANDPFSEIYRERYKFWRLVDPEWLDPMTFDPADPSTTAKAFENYLTVIGKAEKFARAIVGKMHPHTYTFYGNSDTRATSTTIDLTVQRRWTLRSIFEDDQPITDVIDDANLRRDPAMEADQVNRNGWEEYYLDAKYRRYEVSMARPAGNGDGTVPTLSGSFLASRSNFGMDLTPSYDIDHQAAYGDAGAFAFAIRSLVLLLIRRAADRLGVKIID